MSRKKKKAAAQASDATPDEEVTAADTAVEAPEAPDTGAEAGQAQPELTPEQQIATLQDEKLRLMAELRNVGQRAQREKQEALKYAEADFARELLVVLDDLERTLESVRTAETVEPVAEGVRIVYDHFLKVLRGRQIEPIEALGQPFDPHLHEAMMQQPSGEYPDKTVIQELARGYKMHGRVIRSSKVIVSSGTPPQAGDAAANEDEGDPRETDADV
jgi:molecular chaperone GrpE